MSRLLSALALYIAGVDAGLLKVRAMECWRFRWGYGLWLTELSCESGRNTAGLASFTSSPQVRQRARREAIRQ